MAQFTFVEVEVGLAVGLAVGTFQFKKGGVDITFVMGGGEGDGVYCRAFTIVGDEVGLDVGFLVGDFSMK